MNNIFLSYLLEPNIDLYQDFLDEFTNLQIYISQNYLPRDSSTGIDSSLIIQYTRTISKDFINNVNAYKQAFSELVNIDKKLFLNTQSNLIFQWTSLNNEFSNKNKEIQEYTIKIKDKKVAETQIILLSTISVVIIIFIIINFIFPRIITKRIINLQKFIEPLKTGEIPKEIFEPKAFSEIIAMSRTIVRVIISLRNASNLQV